MRFKILIGIILLIFLSIVGGLLWFVNSTFRGVTSNTTSTASVTTPEFSFAVIGDTENMHDVTRRMIENLATEEIDFVVHLGDVSSDSDPGHMTEVKEAFAALPFPTYYVVGNNDLVYDDAQELRTAGVFEETLDQKANLSMMHKNAQIILLDNANRRVGFSDTTLDWLSTELKQSTSPYTFLFYHRPLHLPLEDLFGDDETTYSRGQNEKFLTLISEYSIDRIFNGHIHTYLPYTLQGIPATVSGGGGAYPQEILGGESAAYFHYVIVHVPQNEDIQPWIEVRKFE